MISLLPFASVAECCPFRQPTEKTVSTNHWNNQPTLAGRLGEKRLRSSIFLLGQIRICHLRYRTKGHYSIYTELTTWVAIRIQRITRIYQAFLCECMRTSTAKSASEQYDTVSESRVRLRDTSKSARPIYWDQLIHSRTLSSSLVGSLQPQ